MTAMPKVFLAKVDAAFDGMLARLSCRDGADAAIISHWQDDPPGYRLQVMRRSDGRSLTCFVAREERP